MRTKLVDLCLISLGLLLPAGCADSKYPYQPTHGTAKVDSTSVDEEYAEADAATAPASRNSVATTPLAARPAPEPSAVVTPQPFDGPLPQAPGEGRGPEESGDKFSWLVENDFVRVAADPLSTFSIDVDTASYSKARMYLMQNGTLPPADAVRIEEFVNYFNYNYPAPRHGEHPFAVYTEVGECPWSPQNRLVRVGIQGEQVERSRRSTNLVFLIDVSGSMDQPNKLPLLKHGLRLMTSQLNENDRVSIVVYAGAAGLVLDKAYGNDQAAILSAVDRLHAGGSTNGGEGIQLAYQTARRHFIQGGVNRVLLCTDGDFNVGRTSTGGLVSLARNQAKSGVFLSVFGFGMGNHNDAMLEELSNRANGTYAFIDSKPEAEKVFLEQLSSTLITIAKDVKIQVEFNPAEVQAYRLIGYENRQLAHRDFNDDRKDAGDIGAGHTVTALYEVTPAGANTDLNLPGVDPLKYQQARRPVDPAGAHELLTVKLRYKLPEAEASQLLSVPVVDEGLKFGQASQDFQFAAAVASFGMLLRDSVYKGSATYRGVHEIAAAARGRDEHGRRTEFLELVRQAQQLAEPEVSAIPPAAAVPSVRIAQRESPASPFNWNPLSATPLVVTLFAVWLCAVGGILAVVCLYVLRPREQTLMTTKRNQFPHEPAPAAKG